MFFCSWENITGETENESFVKDSQWLNIVCKILIGLISFFY